MNRSNHSLPAGLSALVFALSLAYIFVILLWGDAFINPYYPLPRYLLSAAVWPLCYLSGTLLPMLVAKRREALPCWLRLSLALVGGGCLLVFLSAFFAPLMGVNRTAGVGRLLYVLYASVLAHVPTLLFPPCVLLATALAGAGAKGHAGTEPPLQKPSDATDAYGPAEARDAEKATDL